MCRRVCLRKRLGRRGGGLGCSLYLLPSSLSVLLLWLPPDAQPRSSMLCSRYWENSTADHSYHRKRKEESLWCIWFDIRSVVDSIFNQHNYAVLAVEKGRCVTAAPRTRKPPFPRNNTLAFGVIGLDSTITELRCIAFVLPLFCTSSCWRALCCRRRCSSHWQQMHQQPRERRKELQ